MIGQRHVIGASDEQRRDADVSVAGLGDCDDCCCGCTADEAGEQREVGRAAGQGFKSAAMFRGDVGAHEHASVAASPVLGSKSRSATMAFGR